jgi:regulator of protease activity HflC (stomatin/prohibitin superfamily)
MLRTIVALTVLFCLSGCGFHTVQTGHRGVKTHFGQVIGEPLTEGLYFVNPFTTDIHQMDTRVLVWTANTEAYTKDVQEAKISFTLNYQLEQSEAANVYRTVGEDWSAKLVGQVIQQRIKEVAGQWDAVDLISHRQEADAQAAKTIVEGLAPKHVIVTGFAITDIQFSENFNKAVEAKVVAQQRALEEQNKTAQIEQQAKQRVIAATAEAQSMKIRADALAQNPKLVQWEAVQKWDGKLPVNLYGSAPIPFISASGN